MTVRDVQVPSSRDSTVLIPELCTYFDIGKTKIYELLRGEKYQYPPKEEVEKKPARRIQPERVEGEEPPAKKTKKVKAAPTTWNTVCTRTNKITVLFGTTNSSQRKYKLKS